MLIVYVVSNKKDNFKGRFFKKQIRIDPFKRSSLSICDKPCTVIEFEESMLPTLDIERLKNTFKGRIIVTRNVQEKIIPYECRFDYKPYFKRALLSSLLNNLGKNISSISVCVNDDSFQFSDEYCKLANAVKTFTLVSENSCETDKFCNYCFVEYGNYITVEKKIYTNCDVIIDFHKLDNDGRIIITKEGNEQLLYPDPKYFLVKEEFLGLINMGIDPKILCAAFEVVL